MSAFAVTVLNAVFLALLYFFVYRAVRSVANEVRAQPARPAAAARPSPSRPARPSKGKLPRSVVVTDERGAKVATVGLSGTTPLQIGRADGCDLRLADTYVSSFHARIFSRDGSWFLEDLGSTNGTYLNQRKVTSATELHAGDRVKLGKTVLELRR